MSDQQRYERTSPDGYRERRNNSEIEIV